MMETDWVAVGKSVIAERFSKRTFNTQRPTFIIEYATIRNRQSAIERADDGIRTRDLRFTKPLLYQLSYVGTDRANIAFTGA
jgi:hypothetical protein